MMINTKFASNNGGFTLIEVMAAVIIINISIVGSIALQQAATRTGKSAYYRSQATIIASDIVDRMQLNPNAFIAGKYDNFNTQNNMTNPGLCVSACTDIERASQDLYEWNEMFHSATNAKSVLPNATGSLTRVSSNELKVSIVWKEFVRDSNNLSLFKVADASVDLFVRI